MNYTNKIDSLLNDAVNNNFIDNDLLYNFFAHTHNETSFFKATGLIAKLQNEIFNQIDNNLEFKGFLETYIDETQTFKAYEYIINTLQ